MEHVNVEIKARCRDAHAVRQILRRLGAERRGIDHQADTYFHVPRGRLKLREGTIENHLIFYARPDEPGPKRADVLLMDTAAHGGLKDVLTAALGVRTTVHKRREIHFLANVKFHLDEVPGLGSFVEIEAQSRNGQPDPATLRDQCARYLRLLDIRREDLLNASYADLPPTGQ